MPEMISPKLVKLQLDLVALRERRSWKRLLMTSQVQVTTTKAPHSRVRRDSLLGQGRSPSTMKIQAPVHMIQRTISPKLVKLQSDLVAPRERRSWRRRPTNYQAPETTIKAQPLQMERHSPFRADQMRSTTRILAQALTRTRPPLSWSDLRSPLRE